MTADEYGISFFPFRHAVQILVPRAGIKPIPPAMVVQSLNHWTSREVLLSFFLWLCWVLVAALGVLLCHAGPFIAAHNWLSGCGSQAPEHAGSVVVGYMGLAAPPHGGS